MTRWKIVIFAALCSLIIAGCSKDGDKGASEASSAEKSESTEAVDEAGTEEDEWQSNMPTVKIGESSAESILKERLTGLGLKPIYNDLEEVDEEEYYTYTVLDSNEDEIPQMLAVNAVSGEVYVYDLNTGTIADYSTFAYYDKEKDEEVNWDGIFSLGKREILLEPMDEHSFEFTITNEGKKELSGAADVNYENMHEAAYEDGAASLSFEMKGDSLIITEKGKSGFAGTYKRKSVQNPN